ncbi:hypothetical protein PPL_01056 [Heterostelium album PN500]|uniref:Uncharacterized protein n=1 Tax=Heterostelium pallidum (strain ATCC 26659 / Pp 5 / PN500) TaxID=670386 RepID=D3AXZ8_HETP5|nr:hypothetical protein PPL_01056 [Heterostelium album PN500]EFA85825.1 hypothetical protein PPL_01056 [Heterostelium album PN500]|eukprot:XP_020437931.1 hypothetical protein PPL_01056 [Heterostelium album PN500]
MENFEKPTISISSLSSEISPSYAMKMSNSSINDPWADNLEDMEEQIFPSSPMSCSIGHPFNQQSISPLKGEYYNFNFRMGTPIGGNIFDSTPTFTHG